MVLIFMQFQRFYQSKGFGCQLHFQHFDGSFSYPKRYIMLYRVRSIPQISEGLAVPITRQLESMATNRHSFVRHFR